MASLVSGFEYDIFISYRQKDNKGDRWVSEFVEALKTELESTFKEEISVYFDINPHDGLLETHDVDASLEDKLKCLVFIPIISRTYCDPKSFAWEHEFKAFVDLASKDQFGLKVKLPDGNKLIRVLPVCIHDLDPDDIKLVKTNICPFQPVDFIYYSQGVNRPLRQRDDDLDQNTKQLIYRDQINKTAFAVKEIIQGLKGEKSIPVKQGIEVRKQKKGIFKDGKPVKSLKYKFMIWSGILTILIITALFVWPGFAGKHNLERLIAKDGKIPIAIMPFQNMTNDTLWDVWQDGVQNILITNLSNSQELKVRQQETVRSILQGKGLTDYASLTPSINGTISKKLETNAYITGSIKRSGSTIRLNAQLNNSKTKEVLKSFQIDGTAENILQITDSLSAQVMNFLKISKLEKGISKDLQHVITTTSPEAFKYFIYGENAFNKDDDPAAEKYYLQAIAIDSNFYYAGFRLATLYYNRGSYEEGKKWCLRVYNKRDQMSMKLKLLIESIYSVYFETSYERIKYHRKIIEFDDQLPEAYYDLGLLLNWAKQYEKAIPEFEKALEIYKKWGTKPQRSWDYLFLGIAFHETGQYMKEKKLYRKAEKDFPDDPVLIPSQAILALTEGDTIAANRYIEKYVSILKENSTSESVIAYRLGGIYWGADKFDRAENYCRQALSLKPDNPYMMGNLAWFLIDTDRKISEGLELADKALELLPDNCDIMDTKGWGLYKIGKYQEALEVLQLSWDLQPVYSDEIFRHLEAAKKAVAEQR